MQPCLFHILGNCDKFVLAGSKTQVCGSLDGVYTISGFNTFN